jgi:hypothetical protein
MLRSAATILAVLLVAGSAEAQNQSRFELGAYGGYLFGGTAEGESGVSRAKATIESAPSYGGIIDIAVRRGAFAELSYSRQPTELSLRLSDGTNYRYDLLVQYFQIGGLLEFNTPAVDWLRPTFGGTIGATVFTANDDRASYEEWRASIILEGGAKIRLTEHFGLRLRARGFATLLTDDSALFCASGAGCAYAFTGTAVLQGEVGGGAYLAF